MQLFDVKSRRKLLKVFAGDKKENQYANVQFWWIGSIELWTDLFQSQRIQRRITTFGACRAEQLLCNPFSEAALNFHRCTVLWQISLSLRASGMNSLEIP